MVLQSGVMRVIDRLKQPMLDERSNTVFTELGPECGEIISFLGGQTLQLIDTSGG
jgi:hypothetical protein